MKRRLRRPSPALVISLIALFVALGGTSYAATALARNSVGTKQLKNNAVTGAKIASGAVSAAKINTNGLTVPNADHATTADSATNATNAANATNVGGLTASELQQRVSGTCSSGSAIRAVGSNGGVTCQTVGSTALFAVVAIDGTLARGSAGTTASSVGTGTYTVDFNRDVSGCAYSATVGPTGAGVATGNADVASQSGNADGVFVVTFPQGGSSAAYEPFHLIVVC